MIVVDTWLGHDLATVRTPLRPVESARAIAFPTRPVRLALVSCRTEHIEKAAEQEQSRWFTATLIEGTSGKARVRLDAWLDGELDQTWTVSEKPRPGERPMPFGVRVYAEGGGVIATALVRSTDERHDDGGLKIAV